MSLFGDNRPKGITREELTYVRGELENATFGHEAEKLNSRQVEELIRRLELCLDPDTVAEKKYNWGQADQDEVNQIEGQAAHDSSLNLSSTQLAHVKQVLQKYVDIDKHGGMFSL